MDLSEVMNDGSNDSEVTVTPKAQLRMPAGANVNNFTSTPKTSLKKKKKYYKKNSSKDSNKCVDTKVNVSNSSVDDANDPVLPNVSSFIKNASSNQPQKPRSFDTSSQTSSSYACSDLEDSIRSKSLQSDVNSSQEDNITKEDIGQHMPDAVSTLPKLKKHDLARSFLNKNSTELNSSDVPSQHMPNVVSTLPNLNKNSLARSFLNKNCTELNSSDVPNQHMPNAMSTLPSLKKHALALTFLNKNTTELNSSDVPSQRMPDAVSTLPNLKKHALALTFLNKNINSELKENSVKKSDNNLELNTESDEPKSIICEDHNTTKSDEG